MIPIKKLGNKLPSNEVLDWLGKFLDVNYENKEFLEVAD